MTRARPRDPGRAAKRIQINPRKSKEIQIKKLGFPWIPLAESGLFNGLQRIQIKKSFPVSHCISNVTTACRLLLRAGLLAGPELHSGREKTIAHISDFRKQFTICTPETRAGNLRPASHGGAARERGRGLEQARTVPPVCPPRNSSARTRAPCTCARSPLAPSVGLLPDLAPADPRSAGVHPPAGRP
jgi:hypothetical protein